jgi:glutamine synthetase
VDTVNKIDQNHAALAETLADDGVQYAVGAWVDVNGRGKSKMVPIDHLPNLLAGSERYTPRGMGGLGVMTPNEDECVAMPDVDTLRVLPWDKRIAWMAADMHFAGREPFALCSRSILKRQLEKAADAGFDFQLGVETEFYVFDPSSLDDPTGYLKPMSRSGSLRPTPAYDLEPTLDALPYLDRMVTYMKECDFGVFSFDAEGGDAQYEFDFKYAPALEMADKLLFFRLMAKQVAKEFGLLASFMPKPYTSAWGSGHHFNMSLENIETGANLFRDPNDPRGKGWSQIAYGFTAGIMKHARAIAAVANPTVNSYKRLTARLPDGSVTWAPIWAAYGDNNRSCMLRLPYNRPALENRGVDSAANTYLTSALMLAAGMEGIAKALDPGLPVEELTYDWAKVAPSPQASRLPRTLIEAVDAFEEDPLVHEVFPAQFVEAYVEMKRDEWDSYHGQVTAWERDRYLLDV